MIPHPFGYITVILLQQLLVVGLVWYVMHLVDRSRRERRRHSSAMLLSNAGASIDLASLAVRLSKTYDDIADPVDRRGTTRFAHEERV